MKGVCIDCRSSVEVSINRCCFFFFIKTIMGNTSHRVRLTFADYNVKFIGFQSNHLTHHTKSCKINHVKWYFHFSLELICHFGWKRLYLLRAWFTRKVPVFHASNLNGRFGSPLSLILRAQAEKTNFLLSIFMIAIKSDSQREWVSHPPCPYSSSFWLINTRIHTSLDAVA